MPCGGELAGDVFGVVIGSGGVPAKPSAVFGVEVGYCVGDVEGFDGLGCVGSIGGLGLEALFVIGVADDEGENVWLDDEGEGCGVVIFDALGDGCDYELSVQILLMG